ncbi:MAG: hypothetical protein LBR37_00100, partial [Erysipelotrichaceae bacterium]|nr:hypothetical protein [Erysipelotrichaceae bacterium]
MKTTLKSTILMMLGSFILSSCGIELPLGNLSLGTTPDIPTWTDEFLAVRTVNEAVVVFESNGWENIETYELEGYVAGIKDLETKPHMLVAYVAMDVAAVEAQFEQLAMAFTELQNLGETELQIILASLVEDGITDLNVSDTAVSYFENGYHCFIRMAGNTVLIQGPGDEDITQDDEILGEYNLPMTLKITHHRNGGNEATLIKVGQDYYATFIQSSVRQYRFLKYDPSSETWTAYEDTEFSSWAMRQTIRASELEDFLRNGAYFGFMLDFAGNYEVIGSDTYLDRSVTIFSDGTNMIDVDDEYGIVLRKAHQA